MCRAPVHAAWLAMSMRRMSVAVAHGGDGRMSAVAHGVCAGVRRENAWSQEAYTASGRVHASYSPATTARRRATRTKRIDPRRHGEEETTRAKCIRDEENLHFPASWCALTVKKLPTRSTPAKNKLTTNHSCFIFGKIFFCVCSFFAFAVSIE